MREPPVPSWKAITTKEKVFIPSYQGEGAIEVAEIEVPAWEDPDSGEVYLDDLATKKLEEVKARHMGLLSPKQIRGLREHLGLTQKEISLLLQLGERSWSRWENGRERPSRSMNVLLCALYDGKIDIHYLRDLWFAPKQMDLGLKETGKG